MLESGDQAMLPEGMIKIPGVPFAMTEDDGRRMEDAKQQLEQNGYVDQSDAQPMASIYLQMMRSEVGQGRSGQTTNVYEATDFDLSNFGAGKVRAELLTPESEAYVIDNDPMLIRVYSDTALGDIFIQEGKGSKWAWSETRRPMCILAGIGDTALVCALLAGNSQPLSSCQRIQAPCWLK